MLFFVVKCSLRLHKVDLHAAHGLGMMQFISALRARIHDSADVKSLLVQDVKLAGHYLRLSHPRNVHGPR